MHRRQTPQATSSFLLALFLLQAPVCKSTTWPSSKPTSHTLGHPQGFSLRPRAADEHVVLADCNDHGTYSSMMAYYPGPLSDGPKDVAVVNTPLGQTRHWPGTVTNATWTTTGVTFTANLSTTTVDGAYAGPGFNDYGPFNCWRQLVVGQYEWNDLTCNMVYDCRHEDAPVGANITTTSASQKHRSLSVGAIAGLAVGLGLLVLGLIAAAVYLCLRGHTKGKHQRQDRESTSGVHGDRGDHGLALPWTKNELEGDGRVYELDGLQRPTMADGRPVHEVGDERTAELELAPVNGLGGLGQQMNFPLSRSLAQQVVSSVHEVGHVEHVGWPLAKSVTQ